MQENYGAKLDQLKRDGTITSWRLGPPNRYDEAIVELALDRDAVYQVASALANRGDHRNGKKSWSGTAQRFDAIHQVLDRIHDDGTWPLPTHRVELRFFDGHVEETEFASATDAALHAYATATGQRENETIVHGSVVNVKITPVAGRHDSTSVVK